MLSRLASCSRAVRRVAKRNYSTTTPAVGFIGLGMMGAPMAMNLAKAGHRVVLCDVDDDRAAATAAAAGSSATAVATPAEVASAAGVEAVVTMLPSSKHVLHVYESDDGVLAGAAANTTLGDKSLLCIDSSTIEPTVASSCAAKWREKGVAYIDAPVSGGVPGATAGTLTFMVGANEETDVDRAKPLLDVMGANVVVCGKAGAGQAAKVCNNLVLAISMIGVSEAMNLGQRLGLEKKLLASIFNTSTARCWSSDSYNPVPGVMEAVPAARDYEGGFGSALMSKDLGLAVDAARAVQAPLLLGGSAAELYKLLCAHGLGGRDFGVIYKFLQQQQRDEEK
mmetsp:Transcript_49195/g.120647  ORF Transcript_49195/g.120647 Transcript_49195/m.120647 type:complete len:338 (-) Transcript_49195:101-1114(-)